MSDPIILTVTTLFPLILIIFGLGITVFLDSYINRGQRRMMLIIVVLVMCLVIRDSLGYLLEVKFVNIFARTCNSILGYSLRPVILVLFLYIIGFRYKKWPLWALVTVNCLIHMTALFNSDICFGFPGNVFHRGVLGYASFVTSGILLGILLLRTIQVYWNIRRAEMWIPIISALLIVMAVVFDSWVLSYYSKPVSILTMAMVCSTLFYYMWLHFQFVREHEQDIMASLLQHG